MTLKDYYNQTFRSDLALLLRGVPPVEARIVFLGYAWMEGCTILSKVPAERRPQFLACLYFTVLVDQGMHSHSGHYHQFEALTCYPKFRVGLGHPAYLNPALVFEIPIQKQMVEEKAIRELIPETMRLFIDETASFFREHMPQIITSDFFKQLLADSDVNPSGVGSIPCGDRSAIPMRQLLSRELSTAVAVANQ